MGSTSRSVSTVLAAGTVPTGVAQTSESAESLRFPEPTRSQRTYFRVVETRRDVTSFSLETLHVTNHQKEVGMRARHGRGARARAG